MKKICSLAAVLLLVSTPCAFATDTLLQSTDFGASQYIGAFSVPHGGAAPTTYANQRTHSQSFLAYNPSGNGGLGSLFISGNPSNGVLIGEITIATPLIDSDVSHLNPSSNLAPSPYLFDATEGNANNIYSGGADTTLNSCGAGNIAGAVVYNGVFIGTSLNKRTDPASCSALSHFTHGLTLSQTGTYSGFWGLNTGFYAGTVDGYMGLVPSAYQTILGGKVLTGQCNINTEARTSAGPTASIFDPADLTVERLNTTNVPSKMLVGYPDGHRTIGQNTGNQWSQYYTSIDSIGGVIFPTNSRSVLFIGNHGGNTNYCYGYATTDLSQRCMGGGGGGGVSTPCTLGWVCGSRTFDSSDVTNESCCYDPDKGERGPHSYPYSNHVWAYDVGNSDGSNTTGNTVGHNGWTSGTKCNTLTAVALGASNACGITINAWDVLPYAAWDLPLHYGSNGNVVGAAIDQTTNKIYLSVVGDQPDGPGYYPVVEVYQLGLEVTSYTVTATAGANGSIDQTSQSVTSGSTASITATPSGGYQIGSITGGDCPAGSWSGSTYTTGVITGDCSIGTINFTAQAPVGRSLKRVSAGMW